MVYDKPWWKEEGWSGFIGSGVDGPVGDETLMFQACMDNHPMGMENPAGIIMCICGGRCAHKLEKMPEAKRQELMMAYLVSKWGDGAKAAIHYVDYNWNKEPYQGGGSSWIANPGTFSDVDLAALRTNFNRVLFAGGDYRPIENTAEYGYFNGAVAGALEASCELLRGTDQACYEKLEH